MKRKLFILLAFVLLGTLTSCSFNPFTTNNRLTGNALGAGVGAGVGAGTAVVAGASKSVIELAGLGGAAVGYYMTTLRFSSRGVIQACGEVFSLGDTVTIEIPTDHLFDFNTSDFVPEAYPALNSAAEVLRRYPSNNILISGNTSGFGTDRFQQKLSEDRAKQVAAYLWANGINSFCATGMNMRKLIYVGYGNYFPIANDIRNCSIRQNSRIQITAYPSCKDLHLTRCQRVFNNIGELGEGPIRCEVPQPDVSNQFSEVLHEEGRSRREEFRDVIREGTVTNVVLPAGSQQRDYSKGVCRR